MTDYRKLFTGMLQSVVAARIQELTEAVSTETKNIVQSGPFKGMVLPRKSSWGVNGDFLPKVLGTYEQELHPWIERAIERQPGIVFNIGAAEGYYSVGLSLRLPGVDVFPFDTDTKSHSICLEAFRLNQTSKVYSIGSQFTCSRIPAKGDLREPIYNALVVMDVEGDELDILDASEVWSLVHTDLIIECHDFNNSAITPELIRRLGPTHDLEFVKEGPRDPSGIALLGGLSSLDRWLCVSENRPSVMHWMAAWAKERV